MQWNYQELRPFRLEVSATNQSNQLTHFPRAGHATETDQMQLNNFYYLEYLFAQGLIFMFKHFNMMAVSHGTP